MIRFNNGHIFDFGCASGAMAFRGEGWWFEQPWRWLNILRPEEFTIIIKTLTYEPRKGNYVWWKPWTCVRLIEGGFVNAIGLTNPGFEAWLEQDYPHVKKKGYKVIVSIAPESVNEARHMAAAFNDVDIVGLQLNVSCPNTSRDGSVNHICEITEAVLALTKHPLVIKLAYQDDYLAICNELDGKVAAFELINTVPWNVVFGKLTSPLNKYGYQGGVSGKRIVRYARKALCDVKQECVTPLIAGGGIDSMEEILYREAMGADGFVFGGVFIRQPWLPNQLIKRYRANKHGKY